MRRRAVRCAAAAVVLLALAGCGGTERRARAESPSRAPKRQAARAPVVMFLGDSYTTGKLGQIPEQTYAAETARLLGWQPIIGGYRRTGFIAKGQIGKNFAQLFTEQLAWRPAPDLVIVSGGHNDRRYSAQAVGEAARQLLGGVHRQWSTARLLLIGPLWGGGDPPKAVTAIRDAMGEVAAESQVPFIDPLGEQWITGDRDKGTGNAPQYILPDGTHPTTAGARHIAERLAADLRTRGLARP
ncbi:SGNH/GDSL hydrolase family protein [Actinoallomurus purpureus]|uniref:SGNH/GDSL hydrolase family protein n=1 Tax=Actinoallomurus purpureus TaxID=478114 RepID=UPI0020934C53|nr:SGNH/GDSL hydrolase family protein [Actinoallomurus purpureus]MCO6011511.1 SGNH/GDSL hydrolase family protein [Actinoallomurus purpureus]